MPHEHILKVHRLEGLTDGVFAIAMTILAFELRVPAGLSLTQIPHYLSVTVFEKLYVYAGSFILLGTLWVAMSFQIGLLEKLNRQYLWAHIFYLMFVCIVPFSANLLAAFPLNASSIYFYSANLLFLSLAQFIIARSSRYFQLNKRVCTDEISLAIIKRIFVAPPFYLAAILLASWNIRLAFFFLLIPTVVYMVPGRVDRYDN
jgi:uncharacterized membrane protein